MLILTRKVGESIVIGENMDILVKILREDGGQIKIGIQAPKDVPVHRLEVAQRIMLERDECWGNCSTNLLEDEVIISGSKIYDGESIK